MKVLIVYSILILYFLVVTTTTSAQRVIWDTYSESGKRAYGRGDYVEAERFFNLTLKESQNLQDDELIARSNEFLGGLYFQQNKLDQAEKFLIKSVHIWEKLGATESDEITYPLSNLGLVYAGQKKYEMAETALRLALAIREKTKNPDIAVALLNLGKVYSEQNKKAEAQVVFEKAFELFILAEGMNLEGIINTVNNLTLIYEETANYKKLESSFRLIIDLIGKNYSMNDPRLILYLEKYAVLLRKLKRNGEAIQYEARAKKIKQLN